MRFLLLFVAMLLLVPGPTNAAMTFPSLTGRVVDTADMIDPDTEAKLTGDLTALERDKGIQFVVATIPSLHGETIENYGYQLGRNWGVGRKKVDDGVILLIARDDRKLRVEVGYGLTPVLTAGLSGIIIHDIILPRFKQGDFSGGIKAGSDAIITQLRLPAPAAEARAKRIVAEQQAKADSGAQQSSIFIFIVTVIIVISILRANRRMGRLHRRGGLPVVIWGPGFGGGSWGSGGDGFSSGGFSGGGGSFGGGGASGQW